MKKRIALAVALSALALAAYHAHRDEVPPAVAATSPSTGTVDVSAPAGDDDALALATLRRGSTPPGTPPAAASTAPPAAAALPPLDAPLASVIDELVARARQGDARAACRLGMDLGACATLGMTRQMRSWSEQALSGGDERLSRRGVQAPEQAREQMIDRVASALERESQLETLCAGIEPRQIETAPFWTLRAAELGHSAVSEIALTQRLLGSLESQRRMLDAYAEAAPKILEREVAAGNLGVIRVLVMAYASDPRWQASSLLPGLVGNDPARGYAYALAMERAGAARPGTEGPREALRNSLRPEELLRAEREASALYASILSGRELTAQERDARQPPLREEQRARLCELP